MCTENRQLNSITSRTSFVSLCSVHWITTRVVKKSHLHCSYKSFQIDVENKTSDEYNVYYLHISAVDSNVLQGLCYSKIMHIDITNKFHAESDTFFISIFTEREKKLDSKKNNKLDMTGPSGSILLVHCN